MHSFKQPSQEELAHDFLWRVGTKMPARGRIGIFNRSHYEEVLTVRVHPEWLEEQKLPREATGKNVWHRRFKEIRAFEHHMAQNGTLVLKFFLNVSREEQRKRFLDRIDQPGKRYKFSMGDITERKLWPKYMAAYDDLIRQTSRPERPGSWCRPTTNGSPTWWWRGAVVQAMDRLKLEYPRVQGKALKELHRGAQGIEGGTALAAIRAAMLTYLLLDSAGRFPLEACLLECD